MQKTLTIKGKRFTAKKIEGMIENDMVILNGRTFYVTYRIDENNMFENPKREDAKFMLLWAGGYKYAICLPV